MFFHLKQLIPDPLKDTLPHPIWGSSFSIDSRKKYLIRAVSGKGKSTLVHILHGSRKDYNGELWVDDSNCGQWSLNDWCRFRRESLSVVFQDLRLFPQLSVLDNLMLMAGSYTGFRMEEAREMLGQLDLEGMESRPCGKLSLGQQQRVAIVRALCRDFSFLVMDEPFSHLDAGNTARVCELIHTQCAKKDAGYLITSLGDEDQPGYEERILL